VTKLKAATALLIMTGFSLSANPAASAQTYSTLYSFCCKTGTAPDAGLIIDARGNLYGTTEGDGAKGCSDCGTVFMLSGKKRTILHRFKGGQDGAAPSFGSLIMDANGNLYGTTEGGGGGTCEPLGCGTVFKVSGKKETVLHAFMGGDGQWPIGGLIMDGKGNLYGTTVSGGSYEDGAVFEVDSTGAETVLYSFCPKIGCADGQEPYGGLLMDGEGNLYGSTFEGGSSYCNGGCGTVFKLAKNGKETVLYTFCKLPGCADGANPIGNLIMDAAGNLYGVTLSGGTGTCISSAGCGTVFQLDTHGNETVLHTFCAEVGCTDGLFPHAGLVMDAGGNLYGTTSFGGTGYCEDSNGGCGTVFELSGGNETVLHSFTGLDLDGEFAYSPVIMDGQGDLYGTTAGGGKSDTGVVFKLTP
jgi:uncharacterized repeat protein (TIGR03803 family)